MEQMRLERYLCFQQGQQAAALLGREVKERYAVRPHSVFSQQKERDAFFRAMLGERPAAPSVGKYPLINIRLPRVRAGRRGYSASPGAAFFGSVSALKYPLINIRLGSTATSCQSTPCVRW